MEEKTLTDKVDEIYNAFQEIDKKKIRKFRVPRRGKVSKRQGRRGYSTILRIDDNGNCDFEKRPIEDSTYRLKKGDYHTAEEKDMNLSYKGKPFIIQASKKLNPHNPLDGTNETYGQKYVMARMLGDAIKMVGKKKGGAFIWIILGVIVIGGLYFILRHKPTAIVGA
jgi:hypothetical protein